MLRKEVLVYAVIGKHCLVSILMIHVNSAQNLIVITDIFSGITSGCFLSL